MTERFDGESEHQLRIMTALTDFCRQHKRNQADPLGEHLFKPRREATDKSCLIGNLRKCDRTSP